MAKIIIQNEPSASAGTPTTGKSYLLIDGDILKSKHSDGSTKIYSSSTSEIIKVANYAALPVTGDPAKVYITLYNSFIYQWISTAYVAIGEYVTGGNAHDHTGGAGATIDHTSLSSIGSNTHDEIDTHMAQNSFLPDNVVYVSKLGDDLSAGTPTSPFLTITAALASITTASSTNPFLVSINAGVYIEPTLVVPDYVSVTSDSINSVTITPSAANMHMFDCGESTEISFLTIEGVGTGYSALTSTKAIEYFEAHKVSINDCDIGVLVDATTSHQQCYCEYVDVSGTYTNAVVVISASIYTAFVNLENFYTYSESSNLTPEISLTGAGTECTALAGGITGNTLNDGILVANGAKFIARACIFYDCDTAIRTDVAGAAPALYIGGVSFQDCATNIHIENPATTGNFNGYTAFTKTIINASSSFFITGKDAKTYTVAIKGGDFTSIADACNAITDSSITNRYAISVGPGVFTEPVINVPHYVAIVGSNIQTTIVEPDSASHNIFNFGIGSEVSFLTVQNAGFGYCAFSAVNSGDFSQIHKVSIFDCDTGLLCHATTADTTSYCEYVDFNGTFSYAVRTIGANGFMAKTNVENVYTYSVAVAVAQFQAEGVTAEMSLAVGTLLGEGADTCVVSKDGADVFITSLDIDGADTAVWLPNIGTAPRITITGIAIRNSTTYDINAVHPSAVGSIIGAMDTTKNYIAPTALIGMSYSGSTAYGQVVVKSMYQGDRHDRIINISKLMREAATMGVVSGGAVTITTGRGISVASGNGFLLDSSELFVKEVTWATTTFTIDANSERYIYIDTNGAPAVASSLPSPTTAIILARCYANATDVVFLTNAPMTISQYSNASELVLRDTLGAIFGTGCLVSENGGTARALDLTDGAYNYGITKISPSAKTALTFSAYYKNGGTGYTEVTGQTVVNNLNWDNGTGTLATLTAGYYAKHSLYLVGDGTNQKHFFVYSQTEYATLVEAQEGSIPTPPSFMQRSVVLISTIIVKKSDTNLTQITDERPRIGFKPSSVSSITLHGDLAGLTADDHTQYLLVSGTRSMTGALNMGAQNITNVGTVDGVTVSAHVSRHLPTGADALTTAAPSANLTATTTNAVGVANSLARSDHSHAITTGAASAQTPDQVNATGSSANLARADHVHNIATATAVGLDTTSTSTQGANATFARSNHTHAIASGAAATQTPDQVNGAGTSANFAKADHVHNIATATATSLNANSTSTQGAATTFANSAHTHAIASGIVVAQTPDQVNAAGSSVNFTRADHVHNIATAAPVSVGTANAQGAASTFANSAHVHDHGSQTTGTHHAVATTSVNGFMSASDKVKLDYVFDQTMTATQTSTSSTYADSTELITPSLPVGNYIFNFYGMYQSANTNTGIGTRIGTSGAAVSVCFGSWNIGFGVNGTFKFYAYSQTTATTNVFATSTQTANVNDTVMGRGFFTVTSAGAMAIQFRSETGTAVTLQIGSTLSIRKVG